ncbi:site-2 protease family protein [Celeribacter sp. SCSIO 80788]|uniref:site-2 protease family protein n=1 Tax=Celeribacter sp. SCSIO 80788 TaxID=3117013 RepID=UPI003DA41694
MFRDQQAIFEFRGPWGVPVRIGSSILLMFLLFLSTTGSATDLLYDLAFIAMLIGSVFLHEMGHAWGALVQRIPVRSVTIHGFGGYCQQARAATPRESELIVAMGPIVTLTLWAVSRLVANAMWGAGREYDHVLWFFETMAWLNGYLAIFNLLPIAPLDGGKLFELILLRFMRGTTAAKVTGYVGIAGLALMIPYLVLGMHMYIFVLFFVPAILENWNRMRGQVY